MAVLLLGPLEVEGTERLSPRDRVVLSALVVRGGQAVPAEQLADALWGDSPPASWQKVVQGCVARLRRALGHDAVQTVGAGYRLALGPDEVDVRRFEALVSRGRDLVAAGEHDRGAAALTTALELWRGAPLPDVEGWPDGRVEAARLEELRQTAEELRLSALAATGRDVVAEATGLVTADPLRESRWHLLALALYRAGRQSDALAAVRRARRTLQDELGLDPGPELVALEQAILEHDASLAAPTAPAPSALDVCPYKGLLVYDRADADALFGREREVAACVRVLRGTPLLVVTGPSGSGKSSLVRAGVVPALEAAGHRVELMTPGPEPLAALTAASSRLRPGGVLVVDQLEEVFTGPHAGPEGGQFLERLVTTVESGRARVVLVLRADHVAGLAGSVGLARLVERGLHLVTAMTGDELRTAIEAPAKQAGARLEPGLVDLLLREVEDEPGALPLLSHALAETWRRREGSVLTIDGYRASGGIQGAVAQTAEQLWQSLAPEQRAAMRALLLRLVVPTPGGPPVATPVPVPTLPPDRRDVLELLTACRLVTTDEATVSVAHEAVLRAWPRLRSWLDDDAAGRQTLRHLTLAAEDWQARGRPASELYRGGRLAAATEWRATHAAELTPVERDFLDASADLAHAEEAEASRRVQVQARQNRRLRTALVGTAAALVLALVAGSVALQQRQEVAAQARTAGVDELVASSAALRSTQRDLAALLAVTAYRLRPDASTRSALLGVLSGAPGFAGYRHLDLPSGTPASAAVRPGGELLVSTTTGGLVVTSPSGVVRAVLTRGERGIVDSRVAVSTDGRTAALVRWRGPATGGGRSELVVLDVGSRTVVGGPVRLPMDPGAVAVSADGRYAAVTGYDGGRLLVFDTRRPLAELAAVDDTAPGVVQPPALPPGPLTYPGRRHTAAVTFDVDGLVLTGSESGLMRSVDPATGRVVHRWTGGPSWSSSTLLVATDDVVVSAGSDAVVRWDRATREPLWVAEVDGDGCRTMTLSADGSAVLCGGRTGDVTTLAVGSGEVTDQRYSMQRGPLAAVLVSPDGRLVTEVSGTEPVLALWRTDGLGPGRRRLPGGATRLDHDADGRLLLLSGPETYQNFRGFPQPVVRVLERDTGDQVARLGPDQVQPVWTGRPAQAAVWDELGGAFVEDLRSGRKVTRLDGGFGDPARGGTVTPDGRWLLAWGDDMGLAYKIWVVWDLRDGSSVGTGRVPAGVGGALTPDGRTMLWSDGETLAAYDVRTGRRLAERPGVAIVTVTPRGAVVASLADGRLVLLRRGDLAVRGQLLPARAGVMEQLAWSADGRLLAARGTDGGLRLVDVAGRRQLGEPIALREGPVAAVSVHPDGRSVVVGGPDQVVEWDLRPGHLVRAACGVAGRDITRAEWTAQVGDLAAYSRVCRTA